MHNMQVLRRTVSMMLVGWLVGWMVTRMYRNIDDMFDDELSHFDFQYIAI